MVWSPRYATEKAALLPFAPVWWHHSRTGTRLRPCLGLVLLLLLASSASYSIILPRCSPSLVRLLSETNRFRFGAREEDLAGLFFFALRSLRCNGFGRCDGGGLDSRGFGDVRRVRYARGGRGEEVMGFTARQMRFPKGSEALCSEPACGRASTTSDASRSEYVYKKA